MRPDKENYSQQSFAIMSARMPFIRGRGFAALGRSGMGEVYRADDLTLGYSVALKFLPPELVRDPERLAPLHAEVRTARQVSQVVSRNY